MAEIKIYSSLNCPFCNMAKELLKAKGKDFIEIFVDRDLLQMEKMITLSGRRTVPQIFINEKPIGGFDDLKLLDIQGQLDELLS